MPPRKKKAVEQKTEAKKEAKQKELPVDSVKKEDCMKQYSKSVLVGKGNNGRIYLACPKKQLKTCKFVLKVQKASNSFHREIFIHDYLAKNYPRLVPSLKEHWDCGAESFLVMERFQKNLEQVSEEQASENDDVKSGNLLTAEQVYRMFAIAVVLTKAKIAHLDLKVDQFLWDADKPIVVTDFGFSGFIEEVKNVTFHQPRNGGWTANDDFKCFAQSEGAEGIDKEHPLFKFLPYLNVWQLWMDLLVEEYEVKVDEGDIRQGIMVSDDILPPGFIEKLNNSCSEASKRIAAQMKKTVTNRRAKPFTLDDKTLNKYVDYYMGS